MGNVTLMNGAGAGHPTSEASSTPYAHTPGTKAYDSSGNEFVYVEFAEQVYTGVWVGIETDYLACSVLTSAHHGPVGVVLGATTSDTAGWVQVRGSMDSAQMAGGDSAATSSHYLVVASSVSTPAVGADALALGTSDDGHRIFGAWVTGAASSATTSATSIVGVTQPVHLEYPYVIGHTTDYSSIG